MSSPILKRKDRRFQISVFENQFEDKLLHSASIQYSYKNKDGSFVNTEIHINLSDLLVLSNLCQKTYNDLKEQVEARKQGIVNEIYNNFNN